MRKLLVLFGVVALTATSGCFGGKDTEPKKLEESEVGSLSNLPVWVIEEDAGIEGVAGVGIAQASRGGIQYQIPRAEADAKAKIASKVLTEVSQITKRALRESNVNGVNDVDEVFTQATKNVVKNMPLSGVKRINMYKDPADGTLYVRMLLDNSDYMQYFQNSRKVYEQMLQDANLGRDNLTKAQEAVEELFEELEKERAK